MPWFWGRSKETDEYEDDEDDDYTSEEEGYDDDDANDYDSDEYTDEEDVEDDSVEEDDDDVDETTTTSSSKEQGDGEVNPTKNVPPVPSMTTLSSVDNGQKKKNDETNSGIVQDNGVSVNGSSSRPSVVETPSKDDGGVHRPLPPKEEDQDSIITDDDDATLIESVGWQSKDDFALEHSQSCSEDDFGTHSAHIPNEDMVVVGETKIDGIEKVVSSKNEPPSERSVKDSSFTPNGVDDSKTIPVVKKQEEISPAGDADDEEDEEQEGPTTIWEKQSLLILAAEHDRVDILRGILSEEDDDGGDRSRLMMGTVGIPPLHLAIHFGSMNTTQVLLRMGADPSIRPNVALVREQLKSAPQGQSIEIPKMERFDGVTAWELAFGNKAYEEQQQSQSSNRWSMFHSPSSSNSSGAIGGGRKGMTSDDWRKSLIIAPVNMAPSKREVIRHAFTAEALRCLGADEVDRLTQLLDSGMPPSIEVGGKDLYGWAVQLGGLKCEELLRPTEALKHHHLDENNADESCSSIINGDHGLDDISLSSVPNTKPSLETNGGMFEEQQQNMSGGKVIDRPGHDLTVPLLINRLDELESLASALSTCLDSLAEEVSVCHGLLLMGGGASTLAAHVKSLKTLQAQRREQLDQAQLDLERSEMDLARAIHISGPIGEDILAMDTSTLHHHYQQQRQADTKKNKTVENGKEDDDNDDDDKSDLKKRQQLVAQIAASETKIMKLRASIADLSEENVKEMEQVERRGLSGGINLVRNLRDELRDLEYQYNATKNRAATYRAQVGLIWSRMPKPKPEPTNGSSMNGTTSASPPGSIQPNDVVVTNGTEKVQKPTTTLGSQETEGDNKNSGKKIWNKEEEATSTPIAKGSTPVLTVSEGKAAVTTANGQTIEKVVSVQTVRSPERTPPPKAIPGRAKTTTEAAAAAAATAATNSQQAIMVRPPGGNRGFFPIDLWQVLLRIVGFNKAAARRAVQVAKTKKTTTTPTNLMIV